MQLLPTRETTPFPVRFSYSATKHNHKMLHILFIVFVRNTRIELVSTAWEAVILPLN